MGVEGPASSESMLSGDGLLCHDSLDLSVRTNLPDLWRMEEDLEVLIKGPVLGRLRWVSTESKLGLPRVCMVSDLLSLLRY